MKKRYGTIISIRIRPENDWLLEKIREESERKDRNGNHLYSGISALLESILLERFKKQ